jgi:hypothetical protein
MIFDLAALPDGAVLNGVTAEPVTLAGRKALKIGLSAERRKGQLGRDFGDEPTLVALPVTLTDGVIEVSVLSRLAPDAPDYARGFIGLAWRIQPDFSRFESAYLRVLNGKGLNPPPPRDQRAVQYFAYPDWKYDRLRETDLGTFEAAADIRPETWIRLRVEVKGRQLRVLADGTQILSLDQTKTDSTPGQVGLWVDIGTEGYFADLRVDQT